MSLKYLKCFSKVFKFKSLPIELMSSSHLLHLCDHQWINQPEKLISWCFGLNPIFTFWGHNSNSSWKPFWTGALQCCTLFKPPSLCLRGLGLKLNICVSCNSSLHLNVWALWLPVNNFTSYYGQSNSNILHLDYNRELCIPLLSLY